MELAIVIDPDEILAKYMSVIKLVPAERSYHYSYINFPLLDVCGVALSCCHELFHAGFGCHTTSYKQVITRTPGLVGETSNVTKQDNSSIHSISSMCVAFLIGQTCVISVKLLKSCGAAVIA